MSELAAQLADLQSRFAAAVAGAGDERALDAVRVDFLGRSGAVTLLRRGIGQLPAEERPNAGKEINDVVEGLEARLQDAQSALESRAFDADLSRTIDVTFPSPEPAIGTIHPIRRTIEDVCSYFERMGFAVVLGPEVEPDQYNFDALNIPADHPAREGFDSFWITDTLLLRPHTSPMQIRTMQSQPPPVYMATMGRCYRRDTPDATHTAMFTQIEGLAVDRGLSLAHLKGTLLAFAREMFGADREVRLRPHFFPFTEPSVEVDVSCFNCARDGSPCRVCKGEGWVEVLGAGMVDPALFGYVEGYDSELWTGYAWGMGVERIAALRHAVPDIRWLWENDLRLMEQFG